MFARLKTTMPRGLYGRAALILIVPIVTIQFVVSITFIQRHFEDVTRQMTDGVRKEVRFVLDEAALANDPEAALLRARAVAGPLGISVDLPVEWGDEADRRGSWDLSGREVIATLREGLPEVRAVDLTTNTRVVLMLLDTPQGPLSIAVDRRAVSASNPHQLLVLMIATGVLMTLIAFIFLRNQLRPIKRLAAAAEAFGKGRSVPYRPSGAQEVRSAGNAFLDMRARIERQIEQRTMMLSGVSHDLRTPLTRLKLGLSMLPEDEDTRALGRDVDDMRRLLDAFLSFARGDATEAPVSVDPAELVAQIVENAVRAGQNVRLIASEGRGIVVLRPDALTRAIDNLIGNAVTYGNRAEISVAVTDWAVCITVEDDGPGIPKDRRDEALRPFHRLDSARNQNKGGGVGLGLSIAADIARSHGGSLRLGESETLGGLRADLVIAR